MRFLCTWASLLLVAPIAAPAQGTNGDDPLTSIKLGVEQNAKGDYDGALDSFNRALGLNAENPAAYEGRGETHLAQGDLADAIDDFTKALALEPANEAALDHRALAEAQGGSFAASIADDDLALKVPVLPPGEAGAILLQRGRAKLCQGDAEGALADATQALASQAPLAEAAFLKGMAENAQANPATAADDFARAAAAGKPEAVLWFWMTKTEAHLGDDAVAQLPALLDQSLHGRRDPWISELADLLQQKTTTTQLIADLSAAAATGMTADRIEQAWFFIGVSREFSSDTAGAKEAYQHVISIGAPDSYRAVESRRRLKILS